MMIHIVYSSDRKGGANKVDMAFTTAQQADEYVELKRRQAGMSGGNTAWSVEPIEVAETLADVRGIEERRAEATEMARIRAVLRHYNLELVQRVLAETAAN